MILFRNVVSSTTQSRLRSFGVRSELVRCLSELAPGNNVTYQNAQKEAETIRKKQSEMLRKRSKNDPRQSKHASNGMQPNGQELERDHEHDHDHSTRLL